MSGEKRRFSHCLTRYFYESLNLPSAVFHALAIAFLGAHPSATAQQRSDSTMKTGTTVLTAFEGDVKISTASCDQTQAPPRAQFCNKARRLSPLRNPRPRSHSTTESSWQFHHHRNLSFRISSVQPPPPPSTIHTNPQAPVPAPNSTPTATIPEIHSPR